MGDYLTKHSPPPHALPGRLERTAAALRFPGTVIAGTAWRQEKSCRLWRFRGSLARVRGRGGEWEGVQENAGWLGLSGKSEVFWNKPLDFSGILRQCIRACHNAHAVQHRNPAADRGRWRFPLSSAVPILRQLIHPILFCFRSSCHNSSWVGVQE